MGWIVIIKDDRGIAQLISYIGHSSSIATGTEDYKSFHHSSPFLFLYSSANLSWIYVSSIILAFISSPAIFNVVFFFLPLYFLSF